MKFPGSKLLYELDLQQQVVALDDLLRSCQQAGLTGFAEYSGEDAVGMIFYYLGSEANALFRSGSTTSHGAAALESFRQAVSSGAGSLLVFELPLDMAHLLRGITNRRRLPDGPASAADFETLLETLAVTEHTGTVEIQAPTGSAMLLLIQGRLSNVYWETLGGVTFEKGEARARLEEALARSRGGVQSFQSDFSSAAWRGRHEAETGVRSRLETASPQAGAEVAGEEDRARRQALEQLAAQVPAVMQCFVFDLLTGAVLARHGRGADALRVALLAEKVPRLTMYLRDLVAIGQEGDVELFELSTSRTAILVTIVPEAQEAIAMLADKSQPTALIASALSRVARAYAGNLHPARGGAAV
ncbi:MAG: hypothetical protein AB7O37_13680 [Vicinamibacteria bacterium]